ncbi:MAG TPA: protein kinase [Kofleriaceae bacterium]|nr:protein kinase [Kofleriaceae bacterium]
MADGEKPGAGTKPGARSTPKFGGAAAELNPASDSDIRSRPTEPSGVHAIPTTMPTGAQAIGSPPTMPSGAQAIGSPLELPDDKPSGAKTAAALQAISAPPTMPSGAQAIGAPPTMPSGAQAIGAPPTVPSGAKAIGSPPATPDDKPSAQHEAPLGTMQLPRGAIMPSAGPPAIPAPETIGDGRASARSIRAATEPSSPAAIAKAAPIAATLMPNTAAPMPSVVPPPMPQDGRYTVVSEIARGGMGRVVEATDTVLGRNVAVKEVLSLDPETLRRFQRETKITARLEHPSIVPVHDAGIAENGVPFYVMRKVGGKPLEDLVARADTLNKRLALLPHIVAASNAIAHAHSRGIVHRDIKPSNILVGDLGETIMIDWGLAKGIDEAEDEQVVQRVLEDDDGLKTRAGIVFGTPGFMAPEQLRGKPVNEQCDVYALGATLYHLLARRPPHHDKNADKMMHAAVAGPPTPLAEIVDGVPPELAAIVDKALAFDAADRYFDARSLAADLQAFLTGQLVAAHFYTPRERFMRFLRKYRAVVGVVIASVITLAVVASVLIVRILDERDIANEQRARAVTEKARADKQRDEVLVKSRQLILANARHLATTDPTRAAALVRPLLDSELWREARDVIAAARGNGIAFALDGSKRTLSLELSRDGQRALAAGDDGVVRIYDVAKRESRVAIDMKGAVLAKFADGERKIVLYEGNRLSVVETATGARRDVTTPTPIARLEVAGPIAYWTDTAGAVFKLDLAAGGPEKVAVSEPIDIASPSPDGRWIALGGQHHLWLIDRSSPAAPPQNITEGDVKAISWSGDSEHLVMLIDDLAVNIEMEPVPSIFRRITVGDRFAVAWSAGRIFSAGPTGIAIVTKDAGRDAKEQAVRSPGPDHTLGVFEARDRVVVSAKPQGVIVVLSDNGDHILAAPAPIAMVATSARGQWIVAAAEGRLLVWDLDAIEPRAVSQFAPSSARFTNGDQLIATYEGSAPEWIDLAAHKSLQLGDDMEGLIGAASAPDGALAIVVDLTRKAWLVAGVGQPQPIDGEVSAASFVDNTRLVIGGTGGVRLEDLQAHTKLMLFAHEPAARAIETTAADGGWVVTTFEDGLVWRKHLADGATTQMQVDSQSPIRIALAGDGTALVGIGGELREWRPDGKLAVLVSGLKVIKHVSFVAPTTALVVTEDATAHQIDTRSHDVAAPVQTIGHAGSHADTGGLVAGISALGGVEVYDPLAHWSWPLVTPQKGQPPFSFVHISPDSRRVLAMTSQSLLVWTLDLPQTAEATAKWLDRLTNATAETPSEPLGWRATNTPP